MRRLPMARLAVVIVALAFALETGALAQRDGGWVGRRVITKVGTVLKVGDGVVQDGKRSSDLGDASRKWTEFRIYRVQRVNGPWLWLAAEGGSAAGWAEMDDVIPYDQAIDYLTSAIRARPSSALYGERGLLWIQRKEYDIAIADCNEAIRIDPRSEAMYTIRGKAWHAKKDYDRAIAGHGEAIRIDPQSTLAYWRRGAAWEKKGEYGRALADYEEVMRIDPQDPRGYNGRAWLRATCPDPKYRDGKRAFEDASRANQLVDGTAAGIVDTLAAACAESGDFDAAVQWQQKALDLLSQDDEESRTDYTRRLELYRDKKPYRLASAE